MSNSELLIIFISLMGGLGLFLYGMNIMSDGLEKAAGDRMKHFIEVLTKNRVMGVLVGTLVTVIVQSSSATTVMVVGFVNAGIMNLTQSVGIIMGANIGTTVTAQLVSINLTALAPITIATGVGLKYFSKSSKIKKYAEILLGFGILFLGMDLMKEAVKPLREIQAFKDLLLSFGSGSAMDTFLGILTGFGITAIVQSSSATTGILIALASTGLLPITSAFPILLGTNMGTTVTAILSSLSANKTAKRAAIIHFLFNLIGTIIFGVFLSKLTINYVLSMSDDPARQLANAHTMFNVVNTLLLLPFAGVLVFLSNKILPVTEDELINETGIKYLDDRILETPSIAIVQVLKEVLHMGNVAFNSYSFAIESLVTHDESKAFETFKLEKTINMMEKKIASYLIKLSNKEVSLKQREVIDSLFSTINDIERVGDHADNLAELGIHKFENNLFFSVVAVEELQLMSSRVSKSYTQALDALSSGDYSIARRVIEREGEIDLMERNFRKEHIKRLNEGLCSPEAGVIFLDIISNLERIGDHASNIALAVLDNNIES
ncbi:MAG: Na/Pi cotransporter family protein [Clostridiales bacterium]|nr:Na/Pi cotransporter family protein [Clostridiales bacterium]